MKKLPVLLFPALLSVVACNKADATAGPAVTPAAAAPDDHEHGEKKPIGPQAIGAYRFDVAQLGDVKAGGEAVFELEFAKDAKVPPLARAWLGVESGQGSMKVRFGKEGDHGLHAHVPVPATLAADAKLWIEIEADGKVERAATAWK
ncbi:MAG: hypothetical protein FJ306_05640 [Planctomycetes bacterium]|nr:hypothetical protein [Planctomycetota bacterium]